jgi:hypothetical protein
VGNDCRWRQDFGRAFDWLFGGSGTLLVAGFAASDRMSVEEKIVADTAAWTRVIQGQSQERRHGERQRSGHAHLDLD